jgi:hypothetical protein
MTDQQPQQPRPDKTPPLFLTAEEAARVRERAERQRQLRYFRERRKRKR